MLIYTWPENSLHTTKLRADLDTERQEMIDVQESSHQTLHIEEDIFILYQLCHSLLPSVDGIDVWNNISNDLLSNEQIVNASVVLLALSVGLYRFIKSI